MDEHDQNLNVPVIDSATGLPVIDPETGEQTYINIKITAIDSQPSLANLESQCLVSDPVTERPDPPGPVTTLSRTPSQGCRSRIQLVGIRGKVSQTSNIGCIRFSNDCLFLRTSVKLSNISGRTVWRCSPPFRSPLPPSRKARPRRGSLRCRWQ